MKKALLMVCGLLALSACAETYVSHIVATPRESRYCRSQGFTPGTEAFDDCVLQYRERARSRAGTPAS